LAAHDLHERNPEPFDRATEEALSPEQRAELHAFDILEEEAFDPTLRSNGAVVRREDGLQLHIRRGSPEYFFEQGLIERGQVGDWLTAEERQGHRVLGVSYDDGSGARFAGFVSFVDRLKDTAVGTIAAARARNRRQRMPLPSFCSENQTGHQRPALLSTPDAFLCMRPSLTGRCIGEASLARTPFWVLANLPAAAPMNRAER
jgi:hypothetical protein